MESYTDYNLKEITLAAFEEFLVLTEEQASFKPHASKWSAKEVMGHLIDSATNNHGRFVRAQNSNDLLGQAYQQDEWVFAQNYQACNWHDLLILWRQLNLHIAFIMQETSDAVRYKERASHNLQEIAFYPVQENEPATLDYFMQDYVMHLKHHLGQIRELVSNS